LVSLYFPSVPEQEHGAREPLSHSPRQGEACGAVDAKINTLEFEGTVRQASEI